MKVKRNKNIYEIVLWLQKRCIKVVIVH